MHQTVFYSWEADLPNATNRGFILQALESAVLELYADGSVDVEPVVERDTLGVPGAPDIATTIFEKINNCSVFVADISIINPGSSCPTPNPNVLLELGYALKHLGWERLILVINTAISKIEDLPFDLRQRRVLSYYSDPQATERAKERRSLQFSFKRALKPILELSDIQTAGAKVQNPSEDDLIWHEAVSTKAMENCIAFGFHGFWEVFATLSFPRLSSSHSQLLNAAESSTIHTFGWPIGVFGRNNEELQPKPATYGIFNSVHVPGTSYDYWALRTDSSFYLLNTYFEDTQEKGVLFFNTRIVRTAEALLYLARLHRNLGVQENTYVTIKVQHSGLLDRRMSATQTRRFFSSLMQYISHADECTSSITVSVHELEEKTTDFVQELLNPLFTLFDFFQVDRTLYEDIVDAFKKGRVI